MSPRFIDITAHGAVGDGVTDNTSALQHALDLASEVNGCLYIPPGWFVITKALVLYIAACRIAIRGDGANVSILVARGGCGVLDLSFAQDGITQPYGLTLIDVGFRAIGRAGTAISVSYGNPEKTSEHFEPSVAIRGVTVASGARGSWAGGIMLDGAWNVSLTDVFVSGDPCGGRWNELSGHGIELRRMCVNAHLSNVRANFWAVGLYYQADGGQAPSTEGLFCSNCSLVGVKRGVWITGNSGRAAAPRMSTLTWVGGLIEARVGGVDSGSAAFHLVNVHTALISSAQLIAECLPTTHTTYGLFLDNCAGVVVTGCDVNAWHYGLFTVGACHAINSHGNTYTNCAVQNQFNGGTEGSRSVGHVCVNDVVRDVDGAGVNRMEVLA